jgi:hypothetical protein
VLASHSEAALYFLDLIAEVLAPPLQAARCAGLELSGGLDSSCVSVALPRTARNVGRSARLLSYGLVHAGPVDSQQIARRNEIVRLLALSDIAEPSSSCSPFSFTPAPVRRVPSDEFFRSGIDACIAPLPPPKAVITGIGGDEITPSTSPVRSGMMALNREPAAIDNPGLAGLGFYCS